MGQPLSLVSFSHKGRTIGINPGRVNYVEESKENPRFTYIRFSGDGDASYAYVESLVKEVLAKLTVSNFTPDHH